MMLTFVIVNGLFAALVFKQYSLDDVQMKMTICWIHLQVPGHLEKQL